MSNRIDHLLEDIDKNVVNALHEIVCSNNDAELLPLFDSFAQEWGLFTLPQIRGLQRQSPRSTKGA